MSECCYTHGETTEADEDLTENCNLEVQEITNLLEESKSESSNQLLKSPNTDKDGDEDDDDEEQTTDDADTVLLAPGRHCPTDLSARTSPSNTERSYCIFNPPPSPVTDSS